MILDALLVLGIVGRKEYVSSFTHITTKYLCPCSSRRTETNIDELVVSRLGAYHPPGLKHN